MTIQWTLVATFLYLELGFIFLLLLPFISPKIWQRAFYSRICGIITDKANVYFTIFIIVLIFFFFDSVREMLIYSKQTPTGLGQELQIHLKLFRSQRNYYISGFTVFLWLVIRKLVILILSEAELLDENESAMKRAQNATETAEKILKKKEEACKEKDMSEKMKEIIALKKKIEEAKFELDLRKNEMKSTEEKALSVSKEYEVILEKYTTLLNETECKEECSEESISASE